MKAAQQITGEEPPPFYRENGRLFVKFDRIDIERGRLVFFWRRKVTCSKPLEDGAASSDVITIAGIEGRIELFQTD